MNFFTCKNRLELVLKKTTTEAFTSTLLLLYLSFSTSVMAQGTDTPKNLQLMDFAKGTRLSTGGQHALYEFELDESIYEVIYHPTLSDFRVFNGAGKSVPMSLKTAISVDTQEETVSLPLFSITTPDGSDDLLQHIKIESNGTLIEINTNQPAATTANTPPQFIIDLSRSDKKPKKLRIKFSSKYSQTVHTVNVYQSDDLNYWQNIVSGATLIDTIYGDHQLLKNEISLPFASSDYLKIEILNPLSGLLINEVSGVFIDSKTQENRREKTVTGIIDEENNSVDFDTGGLFNVTGINLLMNNNQLLEGDLYSRASKTDNWQHRRKVTFYNLIIESNTLENDMIAFSPVRHRHWQFRPNQQSLDTQQSVQFTVQWQPDSMYFLAEGEAPFTVAYGAIDVNYPAAPVASLIEQINDEQKQAFIGTAFATQQLTLQGNAALIEKQQIAWMRWLLWAVLAGGVVLAGWMALSLWQQLKTAND